MRASPAKCQHVKAHTVSTYEGQSRTVSSRREDRCKHAPPFPTLAGQSKRRQEPVPSTRWHAARYDLVSYHLCSNIKPQHCWILLVGPTSMEALLISTSMLHAASLTCGTPGNLQQKRTRSSRISGTISHTSHPIKNLKHAQTSTFCTSWQEALRLLNIRHITFWTLIEVKSNAQYLVPQ